MDVEPPTAALSTTTSSPALRDCLRACRERRGSCGLLDRGAGTNPPALWGSLHVPIPEDEESLKPPKRKRRRPSVARGQLGETVKQLVLGRQQLSARQGAGGDEEAREGGQSSGSCQEAKGGQFWREEKRALRRAIHQLHPNLVERGGLDLFLDTQPDDSHKIQVVREVMAQVVERKEEVRRHQERRKLHMDGNLIFTREANDTRATSNSLVVLHRQHNLSSIIRDTFLEKQRAQRVGKDDDRNKAMQSTLRKNVPNNIVGYYGKLHVLSREDIAEILRNEVGQPFLEGDAEEEEGEGKVDGKKRRERNAFKRYLQGDNGRVMALPPLPLRYGKDLTQEWVPAPIDMTCLYRRDLDSRIGGVSGRQVDDSTWLTSYKAKRLRRVNRRLLKMMSTPSTHLKTHALRLNVIKATQKKGLLPTLVSLVQQVSSDSDRIKKELLEEVMSACQVPARKLKVTLPDRASNVFDLLHVPRDVRLDFTMRMKASHGSKHELEGWIRRWEDLYDCYHHVAVFRDWKAAIPWRKELLEAAANDPTLALPESVYAFMVSKGVFLHYNSDTDTPLQWLEALTAVLHKCYLASAMMLQAASRPYEAALPYITSLVDTVPRPLSDMTP